MLWVLIRSVIIFNELGAYDFCHRVISFLYSIWQPNVMATLLTFNIDFGESLQVFTSSSKMFVLLSYICGKA